MPGSRGHHLWGQERLGVSVYDAALDRVRRLYREFDHVSVMFSGGKDSTAALMVTLEVAKELGKLPLRVILFDEEVITTETADYCRRVAQWDEVAFEWYCLPVQHRNACSLEFPFWYPWAPEVQDLWVREMPSDAITDTPIPSVDWSDPDSRISIPAVTPFLFPQRGSHAQVMGIRADESLVRRFAVSGAQRDNWIKRIPKTNFWKCYPVYDWTNEDVWTAPVLKGWDYNETYDIFEMGGVPRINQRCAPPFGEEPMQTLWMWAQCFPDIWHKMSERVPGVAAASRYSKSELYGFRETPTKPDELTWKQWAIVLVNRQSDDIRDLVAKNVRAIISRHYGKTDDPILEVAPHPITGCSWKMLCTYAARGDLKNRRAPASAPPSRITKPEVWRAYMEELSASAH